MARTTTTALLRTQRSRLESQRAFDDMIVDYNWQLSAKTRADYLSYVDHYEGRMEDASDPRDQLTYQKRLNSANRAFISNEIQRASISVIEGNTTEMDKLNKLQDLYVQAYATGDMDLAQQMRLQVDNQIVKIQQAQANAASGGGGGYGYGGTTDAERFSKEMKQLADAKRADIKNGNSPMMVNGYEIEDFTYNDMSNLLKTGGEQLVEQTLRDMGIPEGVTALEFVQNSLGDHLAYLSDIAARTPDEATRAKINYDINQLKDAKIDIFGAKLSYSELEQEQLARKYDNGKYGLVLGEEGYELNELGIKDIGTTTNDLIPVFDKNGNVVDYEFKANRATGETLNTNFGYANDEEVYYEMSDGELKPIPKVEVTKSLTYQANSDGKYFTQKGLLQLAGLTPMDDGFYAVSTGIAQILKDAGLDLGPTKRISQDAIKVDPQTGKFEFLSPGGTGAVTWDIEGDTLVPTVWDAKTNEEYLQQQGYDPNEVAETTRLIGGALMYKKLQPAIRGSVLQNANNGRLVQGAGGATSVLQQAASAQQLNQLNAQEIKRLKVEEQKRAQQALAVRETPRLTDNLVVQKKGTVTPISVQTYRPPTLRGVTTAPTNQMTSGGAKLQGSAPSLQGGSAGSLLQGGSLSVFQGGNNTKLTVR